MLSTKIWIIQICGVFWMLWIFKRGNIIFLAHPVINWALSIINLPDLPIVLIMVKANCVPVIKSHLLSCLGNSNSFILVANFSKVTDSILTFKVSDRLCRKSSISDLILSLTSFSFCSLFVIPSFSISRNIKAPNSITTITTQYRTKNAE